MNSSPNLLLSLLALLLAVGCAQDINCNLCGEGMHMIDRDELVSQDGGQIPCVLLEWQVGFVEIPAETCEEFQESISGFCTCGPTSTPVTGESTGCNICGGDRTVGNPDGTLGTTLGIGGDGGDSSTCGFLDQFATLSGPIIDETICLALQEVVEQDGGCECQDPCFPLDSTVEVKGRGPTKIQDIKLGDFVSTGDGDYSQVYSFGHYEVGTKQLYTKVTVDDKYVLRLSDNHMVFVDDVTAVQASTLKVGDSIKVSAAGNEGIVTHLSAEVLPGAFAPFTMSGKIAVDGIVSSSYASVQRMDTLHIGSFDTGLSWHSFVHAVMGGQRFYCRYLASCDSETYQEDGMSLPVSLCTKFYHFVMSQSAIAQSVWMSITLLVVGAIVLVENCWLLGLGLLLVRRLSPSGKIRGKAQ